ncbi:MAG: hypothetical protein OEY06_10560 [Gammaproteobacteria bacterium]|nr:hypothetical protein [Gammaproteobacteria bacterium]MDH5388877.1 hypothetical protein [Gammaproteobacteria bacterium]
MKCWLVILLPVLFLLVSCSQKTLSVFFDLPAPPPEKVAPSKTAISEQPVNANSQVAKATKAEAVPLSVVKMENAKSWEEAEKMLPINELGQRDWALALQQSIIQPRSAIGGAREPEPVFKFDFYLKGPFPGTDAFFPHSTHTKHLDCSSCHPKLFRYRGTKITMEDINAGKYCGFCHGTVSFAPTAENCARCHTSMAGK